MKIAEIQFSSWDKVYYFSIGEEKLDINDYVVVETKLGIEMGKVVGFTELSEDEIAKLPDPIKPITRKASREDLDVALKQKQQKASAFEECRALIKKHSLPIKLVDVHFAFDDARITFAFIADGRVDFRDLLKELIKRFKKNIRLQQLGIRDEIKITGDIGCCGRNLCCQSFYKDLGNVTSDLADLQQIAHRGSERLSGVCGRLKCCLTYEKDHYNELADKLPMIGEKIKTEHGRGEVIGWHVLKQSVDVLLDDKDTIVEVSILKENK
ncbi:stage 0 sporulation protein [Candidatus Kuenenbacteria bacterium]|nr:stage 0 sporulation protein [Candidatus Kuenenbacteria bacterium]